MRYRTGTGRTWALALALSATACGGGSGEAEGGTVVAPTPTPTPAASPTPTPTPAPTTAAGWWRPTASTTWQWQLSGTIDTRYAVDAYDIDLFDAPPATIASLHAAGRRVICYFSAGSSENWRSDDGEFTAADRGATLDGWAGERWLSVTSTNVRRVMALRLDLAKAKGCDAVELDNVDGYANRNGLGITADQQLDYNRFLGTQAHARGLAVGLKNDLDQVAVLAPAFDFAVNEQCHEYAECDRLTPFLTAGKPVFVAEYKSAYRTNSGGARDALCVASRVHGLRTLVLPVELDNRFRFSCDD
ncbi:endo alpha-1,4 polygalactosaminidase [Sphingomonas sp. Leaf22]|uniref:endo alpha-1,4 polygalactosaminidase n=1 Tax=Sphingomonas sp. Leaf22 TaxID=1735687 RepID=UPI0006F53567|nr:endo alpha-1,4 polygalactosaminidase [Sphingomonas sp. Leaf22]KQM90366.1 endo alpha-1,4 polygalactosaminidase [Sphingomonas sp. Leaf22]